MPILFNSVVQYVIQPERTKRRVKRDDLDTLSEVWTGPSWEEDIFVPPIGSVHPQSSLMAVINTEIKRMPAGVSEVTINYQGKLNGSGSSSYTSVPTVSKNWAEGEVSYQTNSSVSLMIQGVTPGSYSSITQTGVASYSHRYTGRCCTVAYITNRVPTGNPTNFGLAQDYLGFTNEWEIFSGFQPGAKIEGGGAPIRQMTCTDVKVEDKADGWYRVTETYQSRMFPQATIAAPSSGAISVNNTGGTGSWAAQEATAVQSAAAAQWTALGQNTSLPSSPPGSVGAAITAETGMDPAWNDLANAIPSAAAASSTVDTVTGVGGGSVALSY